MLDRFLSVLGACGLIIVLAGIVPMVPAYAGSDCTGTCCTTTDGDGQTVCDDNPDSSECTNTCSGNSCECKQQGRGCGCI